MVSLFGKHFLSVLISNKQTILPGILKKNQKNVIIESYEAEILYQFSVVFTFLVQPKLHCQL